MYEEERDFGLELLYRLFENLICKRGYIWDFPGILRGDKDTGEAVFGHDYYINMMIWMLPAAMEGKDLRAPTLPGGLVYRIIQAAR